MSRIEQGRFAFLTGLKKICLGTDMILIDLCQIRAGSEIWATSGPHWANWTMPGPESARCLGSHFVERE